MGAHVRRANPRDVLPPCDALQAVSISSAHRLLRRGRPFGPPLFDTELLDEARDTARLELLSRLRDDGQPRGVHFVALCANLRRQFEFVQQTWANNARFAGLSDNKDALTGDNDRPGAAPSVMTIPRRPRRWRTSPLPRFVTVRAGAYFFLPGLRALRFLADRG
jgi:deferrochelatase/peroxidase EfeB